AEVMVKQPEVRLHAAGVAAVDDGDGLPLAGQGVVVALQEADLVEAIGALDHARREGAGGRGGDVGTALKAARAWAGAAACAVEPEPGFQTLDFQPDPPPVAPSPGGRSGRSPGGKQRTQHLEHGRLPLRVDAGRSPRTAATNHIAFAVGSEHDGAL